MDRHPIGSLDRDPDPVGLKRAKMKRKKKQLKDRKLGIKV
jgi:hypothetical protein